MRAFEQGKVWGGYYAKDISTQLQQFVAFEAFAVSKTYDPYSALINNYAFTKNMGWIV